MIDCLRDNIMWGNSHIIFFLYFRNTFLNYST
nr:MAG TPA: hypothetical protein [Caudoviricetes sp.]